MNREYPDAWIQTYTGKQFWPYEPDPQDVDIIDIVHALGMICRFGGHSSEFYSVAQHSVLVFTKTADIHGLLHDAAEAYLLDIPRPLKVLMPWYKEAENRLMEVIYHRFGIPLPTAEEERKVKEVDNRILATEKLYLHKPGHPWELPEPYDWEKIHCWTPGRAATNMLDVFNRLRRS